MTRKQSKGPLESKSTPNHLRRLLMLSLGVIGLLIIVFLMLPNEETGTNEAMAVSKFKLEDIPFDGKQAYEYLKALCAIGPRPSDSKGMESQQKLLEEHFKKLGGAVEYQRFQAPHPDPNHAEPASMANMLIRWHPEEKVRILLCAHYDTLPFPMKDPKNPQGTFIGANDNAGGVAILMQLAEEIPKTKYKLGIDFLLIDGEEFILERGDRMFLGSEYFARDYATNPPGFSYRYGVLLDMVSDKNLQIYQERNSMFWRDTRPLVLDIWNVASHLGVKEFIATKRHDIQDDHINLHDLGKIPCINIIDFDYTAWHRETDTPDQCSALSMAKVGWVVSEWLKGAK
jgi:glutaminyl-peptide cyclotransferase